MDFFKNVTWFDVLVQGLGVLGIAASVIAFQCKKHKSIMIFRTANESFFSIQ